MASLFTPEQCILAKLQLLFSQGPVAFGRGLFLSIARKYGATSTLISNIESSWGPPPPADECFLMFYLNRREWPEGTHVHSPP